MGKKPVFLRKNRFDSYTLIDKGFFFEFKLILLHGPEFCHVVGASSKAAQVLSKIHKKSSSADYLHGEMSLC